MKPLTAEEIREALRGRWLRPPSEGSVRDVSTDTRTATGGEVYFALRGERFDGHDYLARAEEAGCVAAVVARDADQLASLPEEGPMGLLVVPDTRRALGELASYYREMTSATVVAVTGSNGKTTVKRMIDHVLGKHLAGRCSPKSFNNDIGVPMTLLSVEPGDDYVICEVGTSAPGEIAALGSLIRPHVAVVTSVAAAHTEKLGNVDRVAVEKASLLSCLVPGGMGILLGDAEPLRRAAGLALDPATNGTGRRLVRFGRSEHVDLRLTGREPSPNGQRIQINDRLWADLPVPGEHNALNALAAIAAVQRFGLTQDAAAAALADFPGVPMRLQSMSHEGVAIINDAYNANPASVAAALEVLAETPASRRIAVLGDMLELGDRAKELHRQAGREAAGRGVDLLIGVGALGRYIAEGAKDAGAAAECIDEVTALARELPARLRQGDAVLVKGSRGMAMERVVQAVCDARAKDEKPAGPDPAKDGTR